MKNKQKLSKRLKFTKDGKKSNKKSEPNNKYNLNTTFKETNSKEIEEKYGITLQTQHGILPATKIPGTDLIIEDILLLSYPFLDTPWEISCVTICAKTDEILQEEKKAINLLIQKANKSPMCDEESESYDAIVFLHNIVAVPIRREDFSQKKDGYKYCCVKSTQGFSFQDIKKEELNTLIESTPEDVFFFRIIAEDVLHPH